MTVLTEVGRRRMPRSLEAHGIPIDDHYPRNAEHRYRIYRLRAGTGAELYRDILGTSPTPQGYGLGIHTWREEGEITDDDRIGILDVGAGGETDENGIYTLPGAWIVNPYATGGRR